MSSLKTVLIVDDSAVNRNILSEVLFEKYIVLEAEDGQIALELLEAHGDDIAAVVLDLIMPVMDGYAVLETMQKSDCYSNLPVVVTTGSSDHASERKALSLGAWDFVSKPYDAEIILFRLKNAIDRSQLSALRELKYLADYDVLTGIFNKTKFFEVTREMLDANPDDTFVFLRFDVDRFQLINSFFGTAEGDKLLIYIAEHMAENLQHYTKATYGRITADVVAMCIPYEQNAVENMVHQAKQILAQFNLNYDIVPSVGMYVIEDPTISVEEMYNRATLAAKTCKGNYVDFYAYYNVSMSAALSAEQEITNEMKFALGNGQFQIYLQPQYNIHTNSLCGAEALVRWIHPTKGTIAPNKFIPIFERNGFITKLDYYVWEEACKLLRRWQEKGIHLYPISVNISRVNVYNPNLVEMLLKLVERYGLATSRLNLEVTESAYTDNPTVMKKVVSQLQSYGFVVMMDDFGSGYSSLCLLKDIMIDVLKIDMRFLSVSEFPGRGENIIASVIRMAKWLNIPVIAEGAETGEQVDFLRSVGCDYVQGYYFARPMPVEKYEQLYSKAASGEALLIDPKRNAYRYDELFSFNQNIQSLFSNALQAAVIYEFADDQIELIRVNEAYYALLGHEDMLADAPNILDLIVADCRELLLRAFRACAKTQSVIACEYQRSGVKGSRIWIRTKLHYASMVGNKHIIIGELTDITMRKALDFELQKYKNSWLDRHDTPTLLIVDDAAINRTVLMKILQGRFRFLEAENGEEALKLLRDNPNQIDLILLDISMPVMDGKKFLEYKQNTPELNGIPVIMATADDSADQQSETFALGANDYIVKPFIPAVVQRRVNNVLESSYRFKEMVREYNIMSEQVKTDRMTGLFNRVSAETVIAQRLESMAGICALVMLDIDNFKKINETYGCDYGDQIICAVAAQLRRHFRKEDVIARISGDEFTVFIGSIPSMLMVEKKVRELCDSMAEIKIDGKNAMLTCSAGIARSSEAKQSFETLYHHASEALYSAKCHGRNTIFIYDPERRATFVSKYRRSSKRR